MILEPALLQSRTGPRATCIHLPQRFQQARKHDYVGYRYFLVVFLRWPGTSDPVTNRTLPQLSFDYDAQSRITAVRDADGKDLQSHTYDAMGRGKTSSRANGVDSVTVSYPQ